MKALSLFLAEEARRPLWARDAYLLAERVSGTDAVTHRRAAEGVAEAATSRR